MRVQLLVALLATPILSAPPAAGQSVADSSGVRVVRLPDFDMGPARFRVADEPDFRTGWEPSPRLFERIEDMAVLPDGRIVLSDGGATQEVVVLTPEGEVDRVIGRPGEGPGEFNRVSTVVPWGGDRLAVQDYMASRITYFDGDSVLGTESRPFLDHPTLLAASGDSLFFGPGLQMVNGRKYPTPWKRVAFTVRVAGTGEESTALEVDWEQSLDFGGRDPWAARGVAASDDTRFIYGRGDRPRLEWYEPDGTLSQLVTWSAALPSVDPELREWYREEMRAWYESRGTTDLRGIEALWDEGDRQATGFRPWFAQIEVDERGRVWLGELHFRVPAPDWRQKWHVFESDGTPLGWVEMPNPGLRVLAIGEGRIVGYELNDFDELAVVAYPLVDGG